MYFPLMISGLRLEIATMVARTFSIKSDLSKLTC